MQDSNYIELLNSVNVLIPLAPIFKTQVTKISLVMFDSMDRTLKCAHSLESC